MEWQEAQLSLRHHARRSKSVEILSNAAQLYKTKFENACDRWMTLTIIKAIEIAATRWVSSEAEPQELVDHLDRVRRKYSLLINQSINQSKRIYIAPYVAGESEARKRQRRQDQGNG